VTERFVSAELDLSNLPAPEVVQNISHDAIFAARIASLKARLEAAGIAFDVEALETDPAAILQQEDAYRETLDLAAINDAARSVMLAFATGGNLENLAAFYGVARMVITPPNAETGALAVMESDSDLRRRTLLAPEALPYAGMTGGGYRSLALKTAPSVKDVATVKRPGGRVDVVLLSRTGSGVTPSEVVNAVYEVFKDDEATQLTDVVSVRSADIVSYAVAVKLRIPRGPDPALIKATAKKAVEAYVAGRHRTGLPVYVQMIEAAASVGGVERADEIGGLVDLTPSPYEAAFCTLVTVTHEIVE
jgi:phage-related baseplate assembly protein